MVGIRAAFRISLAREREELERGVEAEVRRPARANLEVANPNLVGMPLERVPLLAQSGIVVSRIYHDGMLQVPRPDTTLALGDVLLAVGTREELDALRVVVGKESDLDLRSLPSAITTRRLIITRAAASGKTIAELDFVRRYRSADHAGEPGRGRAAGAARASSSSTGTPCSRWARRPTSPARRPSWATRRRA